MKLFTLKSQIREYMDKVDSEYKNEDYFSGCNYREDGDYSDIINQLRFFLEVDGDTGELMTGDFKYEAIDFYNGPTIIESSEKSLALNFYVVSPKLKNLLEQLELPKHRYYPIELDIDGKQPLQSYFILQINLDENQFIDYEASTFYRRERIERGVYNIIDYKQGEIPSHKTLKFIEEELKQYPYPKIMVLNKKIDWLYYKPYSLISEKAQKLFKEHNIVGMEIISMYQKKSITSSGNKHGYTIMYGGVEIIMNGKSSLEGVNPDDFPLAEKD